MCYLTKNSFFFIPPKKGTNGGDFLFCDECITTYCICCSEKMEKPVKSHEDDSCENIQNGVANLVFKHVRVIQETIFNLSCPSCKVAFYEFDGCAAVACSTCKAGFCGLCLEHCGTDAHAHVRSCSKNPGGSYHVSKPDLDAAHRDMRNQKLREYLSRHGFNGKVQQQIIEKLRKDLIDLGMKIPVVSANSYDDATAEISNDVMRHVRHIQENILTLSCPTCDAAFFDFDGCAAVTCASCGIEFCGLCLDHASNNVRMHVFNCPRNSTKGNYFISSNEMLKIHAAVRADRIQSYFDHVLADGRTKGKVLSIVRRDLTDLQIKLPDITVKQRVRPAEPVRQQPYEVFGRIRDEQPQHRDFILQGQHIFHAPPEPIRRPAPQPAEQNPWREPIRRQAPPPKSNCCIL